MTDLLKVGVLISGRGSNLQALLDACAHPDFPASVVLVISNVADAYGLNRAQRAAVPTQVVEHGNFPDRATFDAALDRALHKANVDLVCLAGFMRLLTPEFVEHWRDRMINIHPSLLPAFKGLNTHRRVLDAGAKVTGCTVHFVRPEMDVGPIVVQAAVPVLPDDDEERLAARVLEQEHIIYPLALRLVAEGKVTVAQDIATVPTGTPSAAALVNPVTE